MSIHEAPPPSSEPALDCDSARLERVAQRLVPCHHDAEDAVQDAWLARLSQPSGRLRNAAAWMQTAVFRAALRIRARDASRARREARSSGVRYERSPLEHLVERTEAERVLRLVDGLRQPYREVLRERLLKDREPAEIAARLGRPEGTVRSQLKRGLEQLRLRACDDRKRRGFGAWLPRLPRWMRAGGWLGAPGACVLGALLLGTLLAFALRSEELSNRPAVVAVRPAGAGDLAPTAGLARATAGLARAAARVAVERRITGGAFAAAPDPVAAPPEAVRLRARLSGGGRSWRPLGGAYVFGSERLHDATPITLGKADDDGALEVPVDRLPLWVWFEGHAALTRWVWVEASLAGEHPIELIATAAQAVQVRVVADGEPLEGATIEARLPERVAAVGRSGQPEGPPLASAARSDARGAARILLPPGDKAPTLAVRHPRHASAHVSLDPMQRDVHVRLDGGVVVRARLLLDDGRPARGARASLQLSHDVGPWAARADAAGRVTWSGVPGGTQFLLAASHAGGATLATGTAVGRELDLGALTLADLHAVRGQLVWPSAGPPSAWTVELHPTTSRADAALLFPDRLESGPREAAPAPDGSFRFDLCRRARYDLVVRERASGAVVARYGGVRPGESGFVLEVPVPDGLDPSPAGEVAAAARRFGSLELSLPRTGGAQLLLLGAGVHMHSSPLAPARGALHRGRKFSLENGLPPGDYDLFLHRLGREHVHRRLRIEAGATTHLTIDPPADGRALGIVVRGKRRLLPEEELELWVHTRERAYRMPVYNPIRRSNPGALLCMRLGVPLDVEAVEVRSSVGLRGMATVEPASDPAGAPLPCEVMLLEDAHTSHPNAPNTSAR
ncbi:MAG: sigma-70 family RNA polymerase sigma factor [Planctomycetota bacterium]